MTERGQTVLELARSRLQPDGWEVVLDDRGEGMALWIDHPLTAPLHIHFDGQEPDEVRLDRALQQREFQIVQRGPRDSANTSLLRGLRTLATGRVLDAMALSSVAALLRHCEILSEAETDWLVEAGPTWSDV